MKQFLKFFSSKSKQNKKFFCIRNHWCFEKSLALFFFSPSLSCKRNDFSMVLIFMHRSTDNKLAIRQNRSRIKKTEYILIISKWVWFGALHRDSLQLLFTAFFPRCSVWFLIDKRQSIHPSNSRKSICNYIVFEMISMVFARFNCRRSLMADHWSLLIKSSAHNNYHSMSDSMNTVIYHLHWKVNAEK